MGPSVRERKCPPRVQCCRWRPGLASNLRKGHLLLLAQSIPIPSPPSLPGAYETEGWEKKKTVPPLENHSTRGKQGSPGDEVTRRGRTYSQGRAELVFEKGSDQIVWDKRGTLRCGGPRKPHPSGSSSLGRWLLPGRTVPSSAVGRPMPLLSPSVCQSWGSLLRCGGGSGYCPSTGGRPF